MIITHNHMIGLPVIDVENGFRAGFVEDLIVNASKKVVEAVILKGGTFGKRKIIDLKNIHSFGLAAVMIEKASDIKEVHDSHELITRHGKEGPLVGKKIITVEGEQLGKVEDFSFNGATGNILFLSVSGGIIDRILHGTSVLWPDLIQSIGPDAAIVKEKAFEDKGKSTGGLEGMIKEIRRTVRDSKKMAEETMKEVAEIERKESKKAKKQKR